MRRPYFQLLFLSAILIAPFLSTAQKLPCFTHSKTNEALERSQENRANREQFLREMEELRALPENQRAGGQKVIPVVFHVIHDNGSENLSKDAIISVLEYVNLELRAQNGNISSVTPPFDDIIGDPQIELRLAKIDHNGNCTDGITRTESNLTYAGNEDIKDLVNWNTQTRRYLQVWLVNTMESGSGGYTYLPGSVNAYRNGIIIRAAQLQSTVSHEVGHWLNLSHTWGPTNEPEEASNCNFDDGISDTPNTTGTSGGCNTSQVTCGSLDNVHNYMDYTSCPRMFTEEQAEEMQMAASSGTGERNYYWASTNRNNTGTADGFSNSCVPNVEFFLDESLGCEGLEVEFEDNSWGADVDPSWVWSWTFPGGTPSSSNNPNPTITYNSAGTYDVTLTISTAAGSESETLQDAVVVTQLGGGIDGPYSEGMEDSSFPDNSDPELEWSIETPGGLTWQRNTTASYTGNASARINLRSITSGNMNSLISPPIDMTDVESADAFLTFRLAHSNRNSTNHSERLRIYASRNCGESWTLRYTKNGDDINTAGSNVSNTFVPDESDWREDEVSLATMAGEPHVLVRFEALSDNQSYMYIDDININPNASSIGIEETGVFRTVRVYPNPIDGNSQLELILEEAVITNVVLVNVMGQELGHRTTKFNSGINRIAISNLNSNLTAGIYFIQLNSDKGVKTIRFVKN